MRVRQRERDPMGREKRFHLRPREALVGKGDETTGGFATDQKKKRTLSQGECITAEGSINLWKGKSQGLQVEKVNRQEWGKNKICQRGVELKMTWVASETMKRVA